MHKIIFAAPLLLLSGAVFAPSARAQTASSPPANTASHINGATGGSTIAPNLPSSAGDGTADSFLHQADSALRAGHTGAAQEALERAETRLLDRVTDPALANTPDNSPRVAAVHDALAALGHGDRATAEKQVQAALNAPQLTSMSPPTAAPMPAATGTGTLPGTAGISTDMGPPNAVSRMPTQSFSAPASGNANVPTAGFSGGTGPTN